MIKESWNLIGPEAHLDTPNQEWKSYVLPSLDDYLYPKNLRCQLVLSSDIADQRIVHSDWLRDTTDHNQPKVVVSGAIFP